MNIKRYKRKPVIVEAVRCTADNLPEIMAWINEVDKDNNVGICNDGDIYFYTIDGIQIAQVGDWIIRTFKEEFTVCAHSIFTAIYEEIE